LVLRERDCGGLPSLFVSSARNPLPATVLRKATTVVKAPPFTLASMDRVAIVQAVGSSGHFVEAVEVLDTIKQRTRCHCFERGQPALHNARHTLHMTLAALVASLGLPPVATGTAGGPERATSAFASRTCRSC